MDQHLYQEMYRVEAEHWWFQAKHRIVASLLGRYLPRSQRKPRLADLGCGCGMLLSRLQNEYDAVGLDGSPEAAYFADQRGLRIEVGQLPGPTPLTSGQFDAVTLLDVLEHLDDDQGTVDEAARLLVPGGLLIATVPAHQWLWTRRDERHHHRRRYSKRQFRRLVDRPPFECLALSYINSVLFPLALIERLYRKFRPMDGESDLQIPPQAINVVLCESFALERHMIGRLALPMGLSLIAVLRKQTLD